MKANASSKHYETVTSDEVLARAIAANDPVRELLARERLANNSLLDLLDRDATAEALDVSARTLDRWHLMRIGPARIKIGGRVRYRLSAILEWLYSCETIGPRAL